MSEKRKHPTYDDKFRASAVVMLRSQGYPEMEGALSLVAKKLKVPCSTLSRWFKGTSNPPPSNVVNETKSDLRSLFMDEIYAILNVLPDKRDEAGYQQLTTSLAIFFDKVRLLDDLPTEIVKVLPRLVDAAQKRGIKASDAMEALIQEFERADG